MLFRAWTTCLQTLGRINRCKKQFLVTFRVASESPEYAHKREIYQTVHTLISSQIFLEQTSGAKVNSKLNPTRKSNSNAFEILTSANRCLRKCLLRRNFLTFSVDISKNKLTDESRSPVRSAHCSPAIDPFSVKSHRTSQKLYMREQLLHQNILHLNFNRFITGNKKLIQLNVKIPFSCLPWSYLPFSSRCRYFSLRKQLSYHAQYAYWKM